MTPSMRSFRDLSIQTKLSLILLLAGGVAVFVACLAFVLNDVRMMRTSMIQHVAALTAVVGVESIPAIRFGEGKDGQEVLAGLQKEPLVECACIYLPNGKVFAAFESAIPGKPFPAEPGDEGHWLTPDGSLEVFQPIHHNNETVGTIFVRASMAELHAQLRKYALIVGVVLLVCLATAVLLAAGLQR